MAFKRSPMLKIALALLILALPVASFAKDNVGKPSGGGSVIEWTLDVSGHEAVELTVLAPDGEIYTRTFKAGKNPSLRLNDLGANVADGQYNYRLQVVPRVSDELRGKLKALRAAGDDAGAKKLSRESGISAPEQSGTFTVLNGYVVKPGELNEGSTSARGVGSEASAKAPVRRDIAVEAQVIPDDLIVQGSTCTGFDCVSTESFGVDTLRLKENNLRINFMDTSTSAGFASNDWRLIANEQPSGGANMFAIEDSTAARNLVLIEAGAPANSVYVDSTGRIGFRQNAPGLDLHMTTNDTPAVRFEQTSAGGFTAQTWDIGANEANFFVRDLTGGSRLSFRIRPGAPTSSIDIAASGNVGMGTASPAENLHVVSSDDANNGVEMENTNSTGLNANAFFRAQADAASVSFQAHGSARTLSRFGQTLGGKNEMLATSGALILGTLGTSDLILGTNSAARMTINGTTGAITIPGSFTVTGTKNFAVVDPADAKTALYYTALEGPEAGTYFRGSAKTVNGEVVIELPGYFSRLTENERMTVQLTPVGAPGQLYVATKSPEKLVIKVAQGSTDLEFDYLVQGVRKGYLDYEVERAGAFPVKQ